LVVTEIYEALLEIKANGEEGVLVTAVEKEGHGPAVIGTKMVVTSEGKRIGTVGGGALEYAAIKRSAQTIKEKQGGLRKYKLTQDNEIIDGEATGMMCGGSVTLFYEYIGFGEKLYIFGAGHIGKALANHLKNLNYYITVMDSRAGLVEEIPDVQQRLTQNYEKALEGVKVAAHGFFLIASHSHALDYVILKRIYESQWNPRYVGLIASKRKAPAMVERLKEELGPDIDRDILYTPVGLEIGGQNPDEIAISIIAELQAVRYGKKGNKHMRDKINV
jgi:xanthine dehydrogenase accessory factor